MATKETKQTEIQEAETPPESQVYDFPIGTADDIKNLDDYTFEVVQVPEWKRAFRVGSMTGAQRGQYDARMAGRAKKSGGSPGVPADFREWIVALCVHDENRDRVFTNADIPMLGSKSVAALERLFTVACRINGLGLEDVEEAEKN